MPALGNGSQKKCGFNGALLAMTMVHFCQIAQRKMGISPHLTLHHGLITPLGRTEHFW